MNENINNTIYEEVLENTTEVEVDDAPIHVDAVNSSNNGIGVLVAVGVAAAAAAVGIWHATKGKREEFLIRKLEKKGYVIKKSNKTDGPIEAEYEEVDEKVEDDAE